MIDRFSLAVSLIAAVAVCAALCPWAAAREQWQIPRSGPAPTGPIMPGGGVASPESLGLVPKVNGDFWKQMASKRIPAGTVFSTILQEDLSSRESHPGDVFQLELQDGYALAGYMVIPSHSRILGAVTTVVPANKLQHGAPGRMDISLQSLVFPDGRSVPISAFVAHNPAQDPKKEANTQQAGSSLKNYGSMFGSFFGSFGRGIGSINRNWNQGLDFELKKGEMLPVRLTRSLDMPDLSQPANLTQGSGPPSAPGLVGPDPDAPPVRSLTPPMPPPGFAPSPGLLTVPGGGAPNAVFNQAARSVPWAGMPDPF